MTANRVILIIKGDNLDLELEGNIAVQTHPGFIEIQYFDDTPSSQWEHSRFISTADITEIYHYKDAEKAKSKLLKLKK